MVRIKLTVIIKKAWLVMANRARNVISGDAIAQIMAETLPTYPLATVLTLNGILIIVRSTGKILIKQWERTTENTCSHNK